MKRLIIFSVLALGLTMASCTEDGLNSDPGIHTPMADDSGGQTGTTPIGPPPPPTPPKP